MIANRLLERKSLVVGVAFSVGAVASYFFAQYQISQQRQAATIMIDSAFLVHESIDKILTVDNQVNKILVDCLNTKACDKDSAAREVVALNTKRDAVIAEERQNVAKIDAMIH